MTSRAVLNGWPLGSGQTIVTYAILPAPAGLQITIPFVVERGSNNSYRHNFDATTRRPTPSVTIYVGPGGDNTKDGLTWANRLRSLNQALVRAGAQPVGTVVGILAQTGVEYRSTSVDSTGIKDSFAAWLSGDAARDTVIEPCDASGNRLPVSDGRFSKANQIVSVVDTLTPAFTATSDARVFVATYGFTPTIATGNGSTRTFSTTLANLPVAVFNTLRVNGVSVNNFRVNAVTGAVTGTGITGTYNASTGALSITWTTAPANGAAIVLDYQTSAPGRSGWDRAFQNRFGRPVGLMQLYDNGIADRTNAAPEINKMADTFGKGAMYVDTAVRKVWVRLSDGRAPDAQFSMGVDDRQIYWTWATRPNRLTTFWMRNVDLMGGYIQIRDGFANPYNGQPIDFTALDTYSGSSPASAWSVFFEGSNVWQRNVVSDYNIDGYAAGWSSANAATGVMLWYELDCIAEWSMGNSGIGDNSANASTSHNKCVGVVVNGDYRFTSNRGAHDIADSRTWRVGGRIGPSIRASDDFSGLVQPLSDSFKKAAVAVASGYYDETGPQSSKTWVEGVNITGVNFALGAYNNVNGGGPGGTLYYRNITAPPGIENVTASPYAGQTQTGTIEAY